MAELGQVMSKSEEGADVARCLLGSIHRAPSYGQAIGNLASQITLHSGLPLSERL